MRVIVGIGLIGVSMMFFGWSIMSYQEYIELRLRYLQPGYDQCLGCAHIMEATQNRTNWAFQMGSIFVIAGAAILIYDIVIQKRAALASKGL